MAGKGQITSERASSQNIIRLQETDNENKMAEKGQITGKYGKKSKLKCEMIWKIWKKSQLNSDKIWQIQKKIVKRYGKYGRKES